MVRVLSIIEKKNLKLKCRLSNGMLLSLDMHPILTKHNHLDWVKDLRKVQEFDQLEIGIMGELLWKDAVRATDGSIWSYDISPEYIIEHGEICP